MEVKIVITDTGSAAGTTAAVSVEGGSGAAAGAGGQPAPSSAGGAQTAASAAGASADSGLSAQDRAGAINAGPAPSAATFNASGAPERFVGQRAANVLGPGGDRSTDESGGAAPGSGEGMETFTTEAQNG